MPTPVDFRRELQAVFEEAGRTGAVSVTVHAGDLHRRVGGYPGRNHRMPVCCEVLRSAMAAGDTVLNEPPSRKGASVMIHYRLPREKSV